MTTIQYNNSIEYIKENKLKTENIRYSEDDESVCSSDLEDTRSFSTVEDITLTIDWEYWSKAIINYNEINKGEFIRYVRKEGGIPSVLRSTLWPIMLQNKRKLNQDVEYYINLLNQESVYESTIQDDIESNYSSFADQGILLNVIKSILIEIPKLVYSKHLLAIALPLITHMPEEESFFILRELLNRDLKEHFIPTLFEQRLYQLDRFILDHLPDLYRHLEYHQIQTHMFTTDWLKGLFHSLLPPPTIHKMYDHLIWADDSHPLLFQITLNYLQHHQFNLLKLDRENTLDFLQRPTQHTIDDLFLPHLSIQHWIDTCSLYQLQSILTQQQLDLKDNRLDQLTVQNHQLQDRIDRLEGLLVEFKFKYAQSETEREGLIEKLQSLKSWIHCFFSELSVRSN